MPAKTDLFLERATAGLAGDPELRLDVQAELRSHVADKLAELGGDGHVDEAVASLGEVVELAEEVAAANRRRLGWRAAARRLLRFALVPVAVFCALWFSGVRDLLLIRQFEVVLAGQAFASGVPDWARPDGWLGPEERLLLFGDSSREGALRYRTLWERNPSNAVYCADYITRLLTETDPPGGLLPELGKAIAADPDNGRYPLLAAIRRASEAAALETRQGTDNRLARFALSVRDRKALDEAMSGLLAAMAMPSYNCYYEEMLRERLAVLRPPKRTTDAILRLAMAASTLLPDLQQLRETARYALGYAELLAAENRMGEAEAFLAIPERLARWMAPKSFTLIEMLVVDALLGVAEELVPDALRRLDREVAADATARRLASLRQEMQAWHASRKSPDPDVGPLLAQRAGYLAGMLLPALGGMDAAELAPRLAKDRELEFTALAIHACGLIGLLMTLAMAACLAISLRWRLALGSQSAPLLLLPSWRDLARCLLLGLATPFAVYLAWTRWCPFSGQAYSPGYAGHRAAAEFAALAAMLLCLPAWLALRSFRRRCAELDLPIPPPLPRLLRWPFAVAGGGPGGGIPGASGGRAAPRSGGRGGERRHHARRSACHFGSGAAGFAGRTVGRSAPSPARSFPSSRGRS